MAHRAEAERDQSVLEQLSRHEVPREWREELPGVDTDGLLLMAWLDAISRRVRTLHGEEVRKEGVSASEAMLLYHLVLGGPPYRQSPTRINKLLELTSGGVTKAIDRLVSRGYVERERDGGDGRSIQVVLTTDGKAAGKRLASSVSGRYREIFSPLGSTERHDAVRVLRSLLDALGARI